MGTLLQIIFLLWSFLTSSNTATYPRHLGPEEVSDHFLTGAYLSFTVNTTDCRLLDESIPPLRNYSFGEDILHGRYVIYGPLSNLTYWRQRYVDNRDVKRIGPVSRLTGIEMDATGWAYVTIEDYDPKTMGRLAYLKMLCGSWRGFLPYAQTPGGELVDFGNIAYQLSQGSLLAYCVRLSWCDPQPKNLTHIFIDSGAVDEYRFDPNGNLVFTYRILNRDLTVDVTTVKMTAASAVTVETYTYSQTTGESSPLQTKTCTYGNEKTIGIYRIPSPQEITSPQG